MNAESLLKDGFEQDRIEEAMEALLDRGAVSDSKVYAPCISNLREHAEGGLRDADSFRNFLLHLTAFVQMTNSFGPDDSVIHEIDAVLHELLGIPAGAEIKVRVQALVDRLNEAVKGAGEHSEEALLLKSAWATYVGVDHLYEYMDDIELPSDISYIDISLNAESHLSAATSAATRNRVFAGVLGDQLIVNDEHSLVTLSRMDDVNMQFAAALQVARRFQNAPSVRQGDVNVLDFASGSARDAYDDAKDLLSEGVRKEWEEAALAFNIALRGTSE